MTFENTEALASTFAKAITRDSAAFEYIASDQFYQSARRAIYNGLIKSGRTTACFWPNEIALKKKDTGFIVPVVEKLRKEFPQVNHFRVMAHGEIIFDTKPNTLLRRLMTNTASSAGW